MIPTWGFSDHQGDKQVEQRYYGMGDSLRASSKPLNPNPETGNLNLGILKNKNNLKPVPWSPSICWKGRVKVRECGSRVQGFSAEGFKAQGLEFTP